MTVNHREHNNFYAILLKRAGFLYIPEHSSGADNKSITQHQ